MTDLLRVQFWIRGAGVTLSKRGGEYSCLEAEGTQPINAIGSGRVVIPFYDDQQRPVDQRVTRGDVGVAYSISPTGTPQHIATFLVEAKQYRDGTYEISGADFLGELDDYVAIAPIGEEATVTTTASSLGSYIDHTPEPDEWVALEAVYPTRGYFTQDVTPAGDIHVLFTENMAVQVTDAFIYTFANGQIFQTTVVGISDERQRVELETALPQTLPGGAKVDFRSTRLRVTDGSILAEGAQVFYTAAAGYGKPFPTAGSMTVHRIELGDGDAPDYIYSADPITDYILAGTVISQTQFTQPTTNDVQQLLTTSTFDEWSLLRGALTVNGSAYAPNGETVFEVLLAISDITGYQFRRYFRGWDTLAAVTFPLRRIEYFKPGSPPVAGDVPVLGTENRMAADYGELFSLESDNSSRVITHLIPIGGGGGSGRFDFREADIGTVLSYYPDISWGVVAGQYYIYNEALGAGRAVWKEERFSHISPLNPADFESRREAANMLLAAAARYLLDSAVTQAVYSAEVYTLGEPLPGDVLKVEFNGVEPVDIEDGVLVVTEVAHSFDAAGGYRVTRLTMTKTGQPPNSGSLAMARSVLDNQRVLRHSNFGSRGDARITYNQMEFGGDGDITSRAGDLGFVSTTGDVEILAPTGDVTIGAQNVTLSGRVQIEGAILSRSIVLQDQTAPVDYDIESVTLRNIPRLRVTRRARQTG